MKKKNKLKLAFIILSIIVFSLIVILIFKHYYYQHTIDNNLAKDNQIEFNELSIQKQEIYIDWVDPTYKNDNLSVDWIDRIATARLICFTNAVVDGGTIGQKYYISIINKYSNSQSRCKSYLDVSIIDSILYKKDKYKVLGYLLNNDRFYRNKMTLNEKALLVYKKDLINLTDDEFKKLIYSD